MSIAPIIVLDDWAGNIFDDYEPMKAAGVAGIIHRIGQGLGYGMGQETWKSGDAEGSGDWLYAEHMERTGEVIEDGTYYVGDPLYSAKEQAAWVRRHYRHGSMGLWLDVELARAKSPAQLVPFYGELISRIEDDFGHEFKGIYSGDWWWNTNMKVNGKMPAWQGEYDYWWATYPFAKGTVSCSWEQLKTQYINNIVKYWPDGGEGDTRKVAIWQFSGDKFVLPGIRGPIDLNYIMPDTWARITGKGGGTPTETPTTPLPAKLVNQTEGLTVRTGPGKGFPAVSYLKRGATVPVLEEKEQEVWARIGPNQWVARRWNGQELARKIVG